MSLRRRGRGWLHRPDKHRGALAVLVTSVLIGLIGWAFGFSSGINAIEPGGQFVDCGRAVFGRSAVLPNADCAPHMAPYVVICWTLIAIAGVGLMASALLYLAHRRPTSAAKSPPATKRADLPPGA